MLTMVWVIFRRLTAELPLFLDQLLYYTQKQQLTVLNTSKLSLRFRKKQLLIQTTKINNNLLNKRNHSPLLKNNHILQLHQILLLRNKFIQRKSFMVKHLMNYILKHIQILLFKLNMFSEFWFYLKKQVTNLNVLLSHTLHALKLSLTLFLCLCLMTQLMHAHLGMFCINFPQLSMDLKKIKLTKRLKFLYKNFVK